jgi:HSF-type DNA-binding
MLEDATEQGLDDIVSWQAHGRAFKIHDRARFVVEILPRYFDRQTVYTSFARQLSLYGFLRLVCTGRDMDAYYHELLLRGRPELCAGIVRTPKAKHSTHHRRYDPTTVPHFDAFPPLPRQSQEWKRDNPTTGCCGAVAPRKSRPRLPSPQRTTSLDVWHSHGYCHLPTVQNPNVAPLSLFPSCIPPLLVAASSTGSYWFELPLTNGNGSAAHTARIEVAANVSSMPSSFSLSSLSYQDNDATAQLSDYHDDWEPLPLHHALDITSPVNQARSSGTRRISSTTATVTSENGGNMDDTIASGTGLGAASMSPIVITTVWNPFSETITDTVVPTDVLTNDCSYSD